MRLNPKEEAYKCKDCGKSFTHHPNLKALQRIHTGRNLTDVKNVERPLPSSLIFKDITESIEVRNLINVNNVANSFLSQKSSTALQSKILPPRESIN